jgi:hypothetical protein
MCDEESNHPHHFLHGAFARSNRKEARRDEGTYQEPCSQRGGDETHVIYVRRDPALIPEKLLRVAERAQTELETVPEAERAAFIKRKSHIWRVFGRYLAKMSYGKCWYSESRDAQSFFDVDHFRPKAEATRSEGVQRMTAILG